MQWEDNLQILGISLVKMNSDGHSQPWPYKQAWDQKTQEI